jgi:hypothetical protein
MLRAHGADARVVESALGLLENLAAEPSGRRRQALMDAGIVHALLRAILAHEGNLRVNEAVAATLRALASDGAKADARRAVILQGDGIPALANMLLQHGKSAKLAASIAEIMYAACSGADAGAGRGRGGGGGPPLPPFLRSHQETLPRDLYIDFFIGASAVDALVDALREHKGNRDVVTPGMTALRDMAVASPDAMTAIIDSEGIAVAVGVLRALSDAAERGTLPRAEGREAVIATAELLRSVIAFRFDKMDEVLAEGVPGALVAALRGWVANGDAVNAGAMALGTIAMTSAEARQGVLRAGAAEALEAARRAHARDARVARTLDIALRELRG